ncbi:tyrosine-type recombinase/integrase [Micromonospora sp. NPDC048839]|uniref:tyrosine-type recombinase/integrase n=1 Tax=Micromonospora sp. NPDC048839 TaxID=3155641 RepID=UPI0033C35C9F
MASATPPSPCCLYRRPAQECARLDVDDLALTVRTGTIRLYGKGDEVRQVPVPAPARERLSAWLCHRGTEAEPLWTGQRGRLTTSGISQVVLIVGDAAGPPSLRPHRLRHTYATRLRQGGGSSAQFQALLGARLARHHRRLLSRKHRGASRHGGADLRVSSSRNGQADLRIAAARRTGTTAVTVLARQPSYRASPSTTHSVWITSTGTSARARAAQCSRSGCVARPPGSA